MKCLFCNKKRPNNRPKYCSYICIKRAWYLKNNPTTNSYLARNPLFWKTETGLGFKWEKYVAKLLRAKHLEFNKMGADLDWNGKTVDVKCANLDFRENKRGKPVKGKQKGYWVFHTENKYRPDFFCFVSLLKNKPFKILLIPGRIISSKGLTIGWKSKYDKYLLLPKN